MVELAAVDAETLAGDGAGHRRGQEHHRVGDLVRLGQPAQVDRGRGLVVDLLGVHPALPREVAEIPLERATPDVARSHRVDPGPPRAELGAGASRAAWALLPPPKPGREWRSTAELIITTDPRLAASAGVSSRVSRSAATAFVSTAARIASRSASARLVSGGIANALCT